ncbi:uncharacterized protein N7459_000069 [Penicillium hispanicum]|uniref:uncharacterized protein n=1 Tax=Penicillium hispanicum TaxID=1080232 RepID=UPI00254117F4|nr:uncharacterized protein N7459_000069 [Penicillium hispanicum]KAJ5593861.1 hypothetical protein N7459_000069 [Penicillium hispanicum]
METTPGSCVMRLEGLEKLTPDGKTKLMESISTDIVATMLCVTKHMEAGSLRSKNVASINEVLSAIDEAGSKYRRRLERRVHRLRRQKYWLVKEYRKLAQGADAMGQKYKANAQISRQQIQLSRSRAQMMQRQLQMLRAQAELRQRKEALSSLWICETQKRIKKEGDREENEEEDVDAEWEADETGVNQ